MARYNEILAGRFNRFLQKHFSMKGEAPAPQLASEITTSLAIHNEGESLYLEGWETFCYSLTLVSGAGTFNSWRLRNTLGSNVVALFTKVAFCETGAANGGFQLQYGQPGVDLATSQQNIIRSLDPRGRPNSSLLASSNVGAQTQIGSNIDARVLLVATSVDLLFDNIHEIVLPPGSAVQIQATTANESEIATFWWRERPLEESERA